MTLYTWKLIIVNKKPRKPDIYGWYDYLIDVQNDDDQRAQKGEERQG